MAWLVFALTAYLVGAWRQREPIVLFVNQESRRLVCNFQVPRAVWRFEQLGLVCHNNVRVAGGLALGENQSRANLGYER